MHGLPPTVWLPPLAERKAQHKDLNSRIVGYSRHPIFGGREKLSSRARVAERNPENTQELSLRIRRQAMDSAC